MNLIKIIKMNKAQNISLKRNGNILLNYLLQKKRKADEFRRFIFQALMKYKYKKNSNKKIITKEKHEINDNINKNKSANINRIKNEPIIKIINKDELIDDIIGGKKN